MVLGLRRSFSLRLGVSLFAALALLMPGVLHAQATAPAVALSSVNVGSSTTGTVTFTFSASTTVGSISVVTQGATGLDFSLNSGAPGTCTAATYANTNTCTVGVKFTPTAAGARYGAVNLLDGSGNILASGVVSGIGVAPLPVFPTGTASVVASSINLPGFLSIDSAGNVYQPSRSNALYKITSAGVVSTFSGVSFPFTGTAVDPAGNVYAGSANRIFKLSNAGNLVANWPVSGTVPAQPQGMAFDSKGNLYVADSSGGQIVVISPAGVGSVLTVGTLIPAGFQPYAVAVDSANTVYIPDFANNRIIEVTSAGATSVLAISGTIVTPNGIAVDAAGNIYLAEASSGILLHITPSGVTTNITPTLSPTIGFPVGVALDGHGLLYLSDQSNTSVDKINLLSLTYSLTGTIAVGSSSAQQTATAENDGNASATFTSIAAVAPGAKGSSTTCSTSTPLASDATCVAAIYFAPTTHGSPQTGTLSLNGSNFTAPVQTITGDVPGDPTVMSFSTAPPSMVTAGGNAGSVVVAFTDNSGNPATSATGTATLTVTASGYTTHTYTATPSATTGMATFNTSGSALTLAGAYTYTVSYTGLTNIAASETVVAGSVVSLSVTPASTSLYAGVADSITVNAYDSYGNVVSSSDTIRLSSTDSTATLPANFALSNGTATKSVTFNQGGSFTVSATDVTNTSVPAAMSTSITVVGDPVYTVSYATDLGGSGTAANCPNQNVASPPSTASCSLRDAFAAANALNFTGVSSASPIINFSSTLVAANPVLTIGSVITPTANFKLVGPGAASLTISPTTSGFSFINSTTASVAMTVSGLTISGFSRTNSSGGAWSANGAGHVSTFTNDVFTANSVSGSVYSGGAIYETSSSVVNLSGSTFTGNSSGYNGGAVYLLSVTQSTISTSTFGSPASQNTATSYGGSLYVSNSTVTITGSTFSGNGTTTNAFSGGAAYFNTCTCTLTNNVFTSNTATTAGGALYVNAGTLGTTATPSSGNIFSANQVTTQTNTTSTGGGAIFFYYTNVSAVLTNSLFSGNTSAGTYAAGGAIDIDSSSYKPNITITNSLFTGNKATASTYVAAGGAIYQSPGTNSSYLSTLTLTGDTFTSNSANNVATSSAAEGGAVYAGNYVTDVFYNDTVTANQAKNTASTTNAAQGGGIYIACTSAPYCPAVYNTIVAANTTLSNGAASTYPDLNNDNGLIANASCVSAVCNLSSTAGGTSVDTGILLSALGNYGGTAIGPVGATVVPGSYAAANGQLLMQSIVPLPGSPALAAGNTSYIYPTLTTAPYYSTCSGVKTATDNRGCGYPRSGIYNGTFVDAGATEPNYTLSFVTQPVNTAINTALLPPPTVQLYESGVPFGVTGGTLALTASAGTPSITSVATTASGLVSLAPTFTTPETDDALIVSVTNGSTTTVVSETSGLFNITDPTAKSIGFTAAPPPQLGTGGNAGTVKVALYNASGVIDTTATNTVTLAVTGTASASYGPTAAVAGVATFNLSAVPLAAGTYTYTASSTYTTDTVAAPETVGGANTWVLNANQTLTKVSSSGTLTTTVTGAGSTSATYGAIAFDEAGDVYSVNSAANSLLFTTNNGGTSANYAGGGLNAPVALAVDGAGYVWIANSGNNTVSEFTNARTAVSPSSGYGSSYGTGEALNAPSAVAVDQAGGVWVTNKSGNTVTHIFGAAAPTVTPISSATATGTLGTKP